MSRPNQSESIVCRGDPAIDPRGAHTVIAAPVQRVQGAPEDGPDFTASRAATRGCFPRVIAIPIIAFPVAIFTGCLAPQHFVFDYPWLSEFGGLVPMVGFIAIPMYFEFIERHGRACLEQPLSRSSLTVLAKLLRSDARHLAQSVAMGMVICMPLLLPRVLRIADATVAPGLARRWAGRPDAAAMEHWGMVAWCCLLAFLLVSRLLLRHRYSTAKK